MNLKTIAFVCTLASLGAPFSIGAGEVPATPPPSGSASHPAESAGRSPGYPELMALTAEERAKFSAATAATKKDPKLQEAQRKVVTAIEELRKQMEASMIAADPSMEPILRKLKEAREQAMATGGARATK